MMQKILVAYFSASGTTKKVAERLAGLMKADVFEIQPELPYTAADLDWENNQSRSSVEMSDRSSRPAIQTRVEHMAQYDLILIGFPIWWYREPSIIDTFVETYDFHDKTIVPFATSGGSGLGDSARHIAALAKGADVKDGQLLRAGASEKELSAWIKTISERPASI